MSAGNLEHVRGRVTSLHLHPKISGERFSDVQAVQVVEGKGIEGNPRYFGRQSRSGGPSKRQVTLIEREVITEHAGALKLGGIAPGTVRSNIETEGVDLVALIGREVRVGTAMLYFYEARLPCEKMDRICRGLRGLMENGRQGVLAQVISSGTIRVGDELVPLSQRGPAIPAVAGLK